MCINEAAHSVGHIYRKEKKQDTPPKEDVHMAEDGDPAMDLVHEEPKTAKEMRDDIIAEEKQMIENMQLDFDNDMELLTLALAASRYMELMNVTLDTDEATRDVPQLGDFWHSFDLSSADKELVINEFDLRPNNNQNDEFKIGPYLLSGEHKKNCLEVMQTVNLLHTRLQELLDHPDSKGVAKRVYFPPGFPHPARRIALDACVHKCVKGIDKKESFMLPREKRNRMEAMIRETRLDRKGMSLQSVVNDMGAMKNALDLLEMDRDTYTEEHKEALEDVIKYLGKEYSANDQSGETEPRESAENAWKNILSSIEHQNEIDRVQTKIDLKNAEIRQMTESGIPLPTRTQDYKVATEALGRLTRKLSQLNDVGPNHSNEIKAVDTIFINMGGNDASFADIIKEHLSNEFNISGSSTSTNGNSSLSAEGRHGINTGFFSFCINNPITFVFKFNTCVGVFCN